MSKLPNLSVKACALAFGLSSLAMAGGNVLVVDIASGPGIDFHSVGDAYAHATEGDTIVVRPGSYTGQLLLFTKGVTIVGDAGPGGTKPIVTNAMTWIAGVPAGSRLLLANLRFERKFDPFESNEAISITNCAGQITIEDCEIVGGDPCVRVVNCPSIHIARTSATGWAGVFVSGNNSPGSGLRVENSTVDAWDSSWTGGPGGQNLFVPFPNGQNGAAGIELVSGHLFVSGCSATGGKGGPGQKNLILGGCVPPGNGGAGIALVSNAASLVDLDVTLVAGAGGSGTTDCPATGQAGVPLALGGGSRTTIPQIHRSLQVSSLSREGDVASTTLVGVPGEPVLLLLSGTSLGAGVPSLLGTLLPGLPLIAISVGVLPGSGSLTFSTVIPPDALPIGIESLVLYEQFVVPAPGGKGLLSSPQAVVFLDSSF